MLLYGGSASVKMLIQASKCKKYMLIRKQCSGPTKPKRNGHNLENYTNFSVQISGDLTLRWKKRLPKTL